MDEFETARLGAPTTSVGRASIRRSEGASHRGAGRWRLRLLWLAVGVLLTFVGRIVFDIAHYYWTEHPALLTAAARTEVPLRAGHIDPSWISEGHPLFREQFYSQDLDTSTFSGTWECQGPAKFRWEYVIDESIYVLEGGADVEHGGATQHLQAGSVVFFPAGSVAKWSVPDHIKKTFVIREPGRLKRMERRLFFSYP